MFLSLPQFFSISSWTWPSTSILVPSLAYTSSIPVLLIYTTPLVFSSIPSLSVSFIFLLLCYILSVIHHQIFPPLLFPPYLSFPSVLNFSPFSHPVPGTLPYDIKIVIAGNHELTFDQEFMADLIKQDFYYFPSASKLKPENYENVQSLLTNCIYLQDSEVTVRGFRIYGSPW